MPLSLPLSDQQAMLRFVDRRHPAYAEMIRHWTFCEQTYTGGREWFRQNIHKFLKEGSTEFQERLGRAYRFNHTREVSNLVTKYIFKEGVIRNLEDAPQALRAFWEHATPDGASMDELMKRVSDKSSIAGRSWIVVDNNASSVLSVADQKAGSARIYAYLVSQQDVLDFARDDDGDLLWILYRIPHRDDADPIASTGAVVPRYMLWTQDEWALLEEQANEKPQPVMTSDVPMGSPVSDGIEAILAGRAHGRRKIVLIDRGVNHLSPEIPMHAVNHMESDEPYAPMGLIDEIAYLDRAVANYLSNMDAIIQDQTFSQLVIPSQGLMPGVEGHAAMLEMSTKRAFTYDSEGGDAPKYISPDAANAELIIKVVKMIIGEIYHSVGMAGERTKQDNGAGIDNSSGVAKAYDFERMNALLCAKAAQLDQAENQVARFVCLWAGEACPEDELIKYPEGYDVRGLPDEFEIAQNLAILEAPQALRRQQMESIVEKLFPRLAKSLMQKIIGEMKDWPKDPMQQMAEVIQLQSSGDGKPVKAGIKSQTQVGAPPGVPAGGVPAGGNKAGLAGPSTKSRQGQSDANKKPKP